MLNTASLIIRFILLCFVVGCSTMKSVESKYQSRFDFSAVESYSTYGRNSAFTEYQSISDVDRNSIELALEHIFDKKGLSYQAVDQADVIIAYYLVGRSSKALDKYNRGVKYCEYCLRFTDEGGSKKRWKLEPGNLIVDVINQKNKRSVWRGVYPLSIGQKDNSQDIQDKIDEALEIMLQDFPVNP